MTVEKWLGGPPFPERHAMTDKIEATSMTRKNSELWMFNSHDQNPRQSCGGGPGFWVVGCVTAEVVGGLPGGS